MNALGLIRYWQKRGVDGDELVGGRDGSVAADRGGRERDPGPAAPQPS
jgi:hypothetical protein